MEELRKGVRWEAGWGQYRVGPNYVVRTLHIAEAEKYRAERKLAEQRAAALLQEHLTEKQWREWDKDSTFQMKVNGTLYRIEPGGYPIVALTTKRWVRSDEHIGRRYGFHCYTLDVPWADEALALKLCLETNEDAVLRVSCRA